MSDTEQTEAAPTPSNVIALEPRLKGTPSHLTVRRHAHACLMHSFVIDEQTHEIECKNCNGKFEAFQAILYIAQHWPDYNGHRVTLQREINEMREERTRLKKEVDSLRAAVRRAGGDPGKPKYWRNT